MRRAHSARAAVLTALAAIAVICIAIPVSGRAMAQEFLAGFADIPLMRELSAVEDAGLVFDSPSGRIAEAYATGVVERGAVTKFYRETLPALGWDYRADNRFEREGEQLTIDFFEGSGGLTVRFTASPAPGG